MKHISVAIVTYNNEKTIARTIESLLLYWPQFTERKLYVIDNGSQDKTLEIISSYQDRLTVISSPSGNVGFGSAHNLVLPYLDTDYHIIMNPDVTILDNYSIERMTQYLDGHTEVGMVVPQILDEAGTLQYLCRRNPTILDLTIRFLPGKLMPKRQAFHTMKDFDYARPFPVEFASGCFMMIRTSLFRSLHGFDEKFFLYAEDADLTRRVNMIMRTDYVPTAKVCHLWERASYRSLKMMRIHLKSLHTYFKKWGCRLK